VSAGNLNLSRRPFVNGRPVVRVALLLWLLGGLLLLGNVFVYLSYVAGTGEKRAQLARVERMKAEEQQRSRQLEDHFARLNLAGQNEQVDFLNEKIAERTFGWSQLFDRMSRLLPADVRLTRLSPRGVVDTQADRRRRGAPPPRKKNQDGRVTLVINGESKSDQALLKFVDNLFADPAFSEPDLTHQSRENGKDVIKFDLRVGYLPRGFRAVLPPAVEAAGARMAKDARKAPSSRATRAPSGRTAAPAPVLEERPPGVEARRGAPSPPPQGVVPPVNPGVGVPGVGVPRPPGGQGTPGGRDR